MITPACNTGSSTYFAAHAAGTKQTNGYTIEAASKVATVDIVIIYRI